MARGGASNTRGGVRDLTDSHTSGMPQGSGGVSGGGNGQPFTLSPIPDGDVLGNITGAAAAPVGVTLSALLDHVIGNSRGSIITRTAASWVILAPGSAGTFLESNGAGANLSWGTASVSFANPTATASDVAVNGSATTAMRSDAAPAVQKCSAAQFGLAKVDGTTIMSSGGVISSAAGTSFANPTATAGDVAVNGSATTAMRSDAAPAVQKCSASLFGLAKVDGTTITAAGGIISAVAGIPGPLNKFLTVPANPGFDPNFAGVPGVTWTISNSNRTALPGSSSPYNHIMGTPARYTGKVYFEAVHQDASFGCLGITGAAGHTWDGGGGPLGTVASLPGQIGWLGSSGAVRTFEQNNNTFITLGTAATWAAGNRLSIAADLDNLLIWFRTTSGNWNNSGAANPATGAGGFILSPALACSGTWIFWPAMNSANASTAINLYLNSADFIETVPAGYSSWSSL